MSAFSISSAYEMPGGVTGDGRKALAGALTGTSSYDNSTGSTLDLSSYFNSTNGTIDYVEIIDESGEYLFKYNVGTDTSDGVVKAFGISYADVEYAHDSALFDASSTSDTTTWEQPANSTLLGARVTVDTTFAGITGPLKVTIGDGSDADGILTDTVDLIGASTGVDSTPDLGALMENNGGYYVSSATDLTLTATSSSGNVEDTSGGKITVRYYYVAGDDYRILPQYGELIDSMDLSGLTLRFLAVGKDA